jgi:hypothetical protein
MPGINRFTRTFGVKCAPAGWRMSGLGGALNPGAGRNVYRGEHMTMVSAAAAAHSAP